MFWLKLRVYLDAARHAPWGFATALWSRIRGKRLRSRSQFAPLLARSPRAYALWLRSEPRFESVHLGGAGPRIIALVRATQDSSELAVTRQSLAAENVDAVIVDTPGGPSFGDAVARIGEGPDLWLMPLAAGDVLAHGAADAYRAGLTGIEANVIYADDDLRDVNGRRTDPHFKPEWNAELFGHFDYLTGACIVRAVGVGHAAREAESLVAAQAAKSAPVHLPKILHHRVGRPQPNRPSPIALAECAWPLVSVIVPTRDRLDLLRACLDGVEAADYPGIEVLVVDNGSSDRATLAYLDALDPELYRVLHQPGAFNYSLLNNRAVEEAKGQVLCLLNNDIEMIEPGWLKLMVYQALRDDVGAVGAQLLYPDGRIQHAGVVLGVGGAAAHAHRLLEPNARGYFHRHALPQFVSAVTGACLVVMRERYLAVGGFDEMTFPVAFNDVDLCLRLNQRGWLSLYEPRAQLIHRESVSRGLDRDAEGALRFAGELQALQRRWHTDRIIDPYHHRQLSQFSDQFVIAM